MNWMDLAKKYGAWAAILVVTFAAGRYTMRSAVEKEVEKQYEEKFSHQLSEVEQKMSLQLKESVETIRKEVQTASEKNQQIDEHIVVKPDGTHTVDRKIRTKERTKTKSTTNKDKTTKEVTKDESTKTKTEETKSETKESIKTVEKVIPPPSWRVFAAAAVSSPTQAREPSYGAGAQYDFGVVNVGGFGLYSPEKQDTTLGLTVGVSF